MDLISYLRVFRRRWSLLLVPLLAATALAWATLPEQEEVVPLAPSYSATATLIVTSGISGVTVEAPISLSTVALFAGLGEIPKRAAKSIGYDGEPQVLASLVTVAPASETGTLTISSTDSDADVVVRRVNAFATATVDFFREKAESETRGRMRAVTAQLDQSAQRIEAVERQLSTEPGNAILEAQLSALKSQYSTQFAELTSLSTRLGGRGPLTVLQEAVAIPQVSSGFTAPTSPASRLGVAGVLGLLLGAALALVVERLDARMRSRDQVEDNFGLPVLAEIPAQAWGQRRSREIISAERPASPTAEAYRSLRSAVLLLRPEGGRPLPGRVDGSWHPLVVMISSALPGEGKTTVAANLAAVVAEGGRRVLLLELDLRNPKLHEYFGMGEVTGITDLLAADRGRHLDRIIRDTTLPGVRIGTAGTRLDHPGALLASAGPMLEQARQLADVVILDTPPMLSVSDAVDLAHHIDVALVVTRHNRTTTAHAVATQRLMTRLGVPALGAVLVGSSASGGPDSYRFGGLQGLGGRGGGERPNDAASRNREAAGPLEQSNP